MPNDWFKPSSAAVVRPVPWLSMPAREYLASIVRLHFHVAEHGGGGSTVWFASQCAHVTTVENKLNWFTALAEKNLPNTTLIYGDEIPHFNEPIDLVLIDGEPVENRGKWITAAPRMVKPGGWVVLDNANRPEYKRERDELQKYADLVATFDSNKPAGFLYLVTEFWKMKGGE